MIIANIIEYILPSADLIDRSNSIIYTYCNRHNVNGDYSKKNMSETRKNHLNIDGGQVKEDENVASYKPIPESDTDFRSSKNSIHKSKEKISADGAEEKLLDKEQEAKIVRVDMADAKYVVGDHRNGDAKIELDANKRQFTGLSKEELMKYAEDPFWVRLRWFMFVLFWALWLAMLGGAILIIIRAPKCSLPSERTWYEKGPLVDAASIASYADIEQELPFMQASKVAGVFTYVCKDAYEVLEDKSTCLEQFKKFVAEAKKYSIKVIVDLTANFVSTSHRWFQKSENRSAEYSDYFIWAPGHEFDPEQPSTVPKPPNNWVSTLNAPAWTWSERRREFYLHQFGEEEADLNFNNTEVVRKFDAVIKLWMAAGADGIRLRNGRELFVNSSLADEVERTGQGSAPGADHTQHAYWRHRHTADQPELDALLAHWGHLTRGPPSEDTVFTLYERAGRPELFLTARNSSALRPPSTGPMPAALPSAVEAASEIRKRLPRWPALKLVTEVDGDEELAAFSMLLPAAPVLTLNQLISRDNDTNSTSFAHVSALRGERVVQYGNTVVAAVPAQESDLPAMLACVRWKAGVLGYAAVYNPGDMEARGDFSSLPQLPAALTVHHLTPALRLNSNFTLNDVVQRDLMYVPAKATVLVSFSNKSTEE